MKKLLSAMLLLSFTVLSAQKVKMKNGTVYVNQKEFLKYKGDAFYTFDGVRLFTITKETVEVQFNNNHSNVISSNTTNAQLLASRVSRTQKLQYKLVKFHLFKLEYETNENKKKIIRQFYRAKLINDKGIVDQSRAFNFAQLAHQNISGNLERLGQ